jgi:hypothetical protein
VDTDETGRPVAGAAVSFHLPEDGPSGTFPNGLRTAVVTTDERGRAVLRGMQLNRVSGRLQVRIIASKEQATAGMASFQYIANPARPAAMAGAGNRKTQGPRDFSSGSRAYKKWLLMLAAAGGGARRPPHWPAAPEGSVCIRGRNQVFQGFSRRFVGRRW